MPFGNYLLLKKLATGGMAEIFLARDTVNARFAVIKRILPFLLEEPEFVGMFLDEARIVSMLNHPNIVGLYELGQLKEGLFLAMEWVDGVDLRRLMQKEEQRHNTIPVGMAAFAMARLCEGLHYAHNRTGPDGKPLGLIHRDVSPQNVMVSFNGEVKLVDFGIAKASSWASRSRPGVIKGKFLYLSPEQLAQEKLDHRSDIFSLGSLMYELVTGKNPFLRTTTEAVIYAIRLEDAPLAHLQKPGIPVTLSRIIAKCLQKDRRKRYQSADEVRRALEDFLHAERPTREREFGQYIESAFGDDEERTSVYLPPNAQSDEDETSEPTRQIGRHTETTTPVGRRPTPDGTPAVALGAGAVPSTRADRLNARPSAPTVPPRGGSVDEPEPKTVPLSKPDVPARRSGSKPKPVPLGDSEYDLESVPMPTRNLRSPGSNPSAPMPQTPEPVDPEEIEPEPSAVSGSTTNDYRPMRTREPEEAQSDAQDVTDPHQGKFPQQPDFEASRRAGQGPRILAMVGVALIAAAAVAGVVWLKFRGGGESAPVVRKRVPDGGTGAPVAVTALSDVDGGEVMLAATDDAGAAVGASPSDAGDAGAAVESDAGVESPDAGLAVDPDLVVLKKPVLSRVIFKAPRGTVLEFNGKVLKLDVVTELQVGEISVKVKCPVVRKRRPRPFIKSVTVPAPTAKPAVFQIKCR